MSVAGLSLRFVLFALVCLACLAWLISMIGNVSWFADRVTYEAEVADVGGLLVDDRVEVAGVEVGKVEGIDVERDRAVVTFSVNEDVQLDNETVVQVRWRNALGTRLIELDTGGGSAVDPGYRFAVEDTRAPADIDTFLTRANPMLQAIDVEMSNELLRELSGALEGREAQVQELVSEAAEVLDVVATRDEAVASALRDGAEIADAYVERRETVQRLLAEAAELGEGLSQRTDVLLDAVSALSDAQDELEQLVDDNDATIRDLLTDVDRLTTIVGEHQDDVSRILETTGTGVVQYHRISRWGEWFNIRAPAISISEQVLLTERGAELPPRQER